MDLFTRLIEAEAEWAVLWIAVLAILLSVATYAVKRLRGKTLQQEPVASQLLTKFHELHSRGELNDTEYRTIRTTLAAQIEQQLKDNGEKG